MAQLRPLTYGDLPAAVEIQNAVYQPLYRETAPILGSRIATAPTCCWGAFLHDRLSAYILSHPWPAGSPPAIGETLTPGPPGDNWFIHDLAISPQVRSQGLGRELIARAARAAQTLGLTRGDLIAVQGAASFWSRFGFTSPEHLSPDLAAKVAGYGDDARYMTVDLADLRV